MSDVWLYQGNCLDILPEVEKADVIISDPPYNVGVNYSDKVNDKLSKDKYNGLIKEIVGHGHRIANGNMVFVLGAKRKILLPWWVNLPDAEMIIVRVGAVSHNVAKNLTLQFRGILTTVESNTKARNLWEDIRWPDEGYFFNESLYGHPAMTPERLAKKLVSYFSEPGQVIIDCYMGSGTIGVACVKTGRKFIGIEINPEYYATAEKRIKEAQLQMRLPI